MLKNCAWTQCNMSDLLYLLMRNCASATYDKAYSSWTWKLETLSTLSFTTIHYIYLISLLIHEKYTIADLLLAAFPTNQIARSKCI